MNLMPAMATADPREERVRTIWHVHVPFREREREREREKEEVMSPLPSTRPYTRLYWGDVIKSRGSRVELDAGDGDGQPDPREDVRVVALPRGERLGSRVWGLGFTVEGSGCRVQDFSS